MIAGVLSAGFAAGAYAQGAATAVSEARVRLACGTGRVIGAETLANGSIRVTCEQQARVPAELGLGGLTPEATAAIVATVVLLPILLDDDDSSGTTTTSSTMPNSSNP